jgi:hypothetical protein
MQKGSRTCDLLRKLHGIRKDSLTISSIMIQPSIFKTDGRINNISQFSKACMCWNSPTCYLYQSNKKERKQ